MIRKNIMHVKRNEKHPVRKTLFFHEDSSEMCGSFLII